MNDLVGEEQPDWPFIARDASTTPSAPTPSMATA
jgi:hypothetical protein